MSHKSVWVVLHGGGNEKLDIMKIFIEKDDAIHYVRKHKPKRQTISFCATGMDTKKWIEDDEELFYGHFDDHWSIKEYILN